MMKALRLHAFGNPPALSLDEVPDVTPGPGEFLVEVKACGLNPVGWKECQHEGFVKQAQLHFILGWDIAGTVISVPEGVNTFRPGDEVYGMPGIRGGPLLKPCPFVRRKWLKSLRLSISLGQQQCRSPL
jgi:NADPH:quinone reductase-like Zn-dependent oxidoreductase